MGGWMGVVLTDACCHDGGYSAGHLSGGLVHDARVGHELVAV